MKPLAIAHRGLHKNCYENTVEAFRAAAEGQYYGIETDIHLTKDNRWVIHHDPTFLSGGKEYVIKELSFEEATRLPLDNDMGIENAFCPSLEDYLEICNNSGKRPIIEIKPKQVPYKYLKSLILSVNKYMGMENVTVIAFYPWPLLRLRRLYRKKIHLQQLLEEYLVLKKLALFKKMDIDMAYAKLTSRDVEKFHRRGLKVNVWTVDDIETLRRMEDMGVDYITSNEFDQNS